LLLIACAPFHHGAQRPTRAVVGPVADTPPMTITAKCNDSSGINFAGGNLFTEVRTWTLP
jgi:hypothetical protein